LLLVAAIPSLLSRGGGSPIDTPAATSQASQFDIPAVVPAVTPFRIDRPSPTPEPTPAPSFRTYTVQSGDTVTRIANKFGLKTWELLTANPTLQANPALLHIGMVLNIPKHGQLTPAP
jgi:Tfp pilus assembly protein FimV